jgi:hypothetical protein
MPQQTINIGSAPDDGTGDPLRDAFDKANDNFTELYAAFAASGASWKSPVRAATTGAGTLATSFENGDTLDGVTLATGDRILIKDQAAPAENGIYVVAASGAPARAADADAGTELVNAAVLVAEGTANADKLFICTTNAPITLNTTGLTFVDFTPGLALEVQDEGSPEDSAVVEINFVGAGVTVTNPGAGQVEVTIPGGGAGGTFAYEAIPTVVPDLTDFATWRNQGTAAVAADSYGVVFTNDIDGELHIREQNMPSLPFSYYARIRLETYDTGAATASVFILGGFAIINSTSGRVLFCYLMSQRVSGDENNIYFAAIDTYSSVTTGVATVAGPAYALEPFHWLRIDVTATDVTLFGSVDGRRWTQIGSAVAFATYLNAAGGTADKFGICVRSSGAGTHKMLFDVLQDSAP